MQNKADTGKRQARWYYIGIDNGVTGLISVLTDKGECKFHERVPVKKVQNYTKTKQNVSRIDVGKLENMLVPYTYDFGHTLVVMERPMVNPGRFKASLSAVRALEATLIVLERLKLPYMFADSKEWQHKFLAGGTAHDQLKEAADRKATELFPKVKIIEGDSLLMAEWARQMKL